MAGMCKSQTTNYNQYYETLMLHAYTYMKSETPKEAYLQTDVSFHNALCKLCMWLPIELRGAISRAIP